MVTPLGQANVLKLVLGKERLKWELYAKYGRYFYLLTMEHLAQLTAALELKLY